MPLTKDLKKFKVSYEVAKSLTIEAPDREEAIKIAMEKIVAAGEIATTNLVLDEA